MKDAAADVIAGGEVTGKPFETTLLHRPAKLKAKRLLLLGGGKAKSFSAFDLRRLAGAAVRTLKSKGLRSFAFLAPEAGLKMEDSVKAIVEGAFVGNFDPDYYKSDRKDQKIDRLHRGRKRRSGQTAGRAGRRPHRCRVAEFRARPGQRTGQSHDADHAGRARHKDGRAKWIEGRSLIAPAARSKN